MTIDDIFFYLRDQAETTDITAGVKAAFLDSLLSTSYCEESAGALSLYTPFAGIVFQDIASFKASLEKLLPLYPLGAELFINFPTKEATAGIPLFTPDMVISRMLKVVTETGNKDDLLLPTLHQPGPVSGGGTETNTAASTGRGHAAKKARHQLSCEVKKKDLPEALGFTVRMQYLTQPGFFSLMDVVLHYLAAWLPVAAGIAPVPPTLSFGHHCNILTPTEPVASHNLCWEQLGVASMRIYSIENLDEEPYDIHFYQRVRQVSGAGFRKVSLDVGVRTNLLSKIDQGIPGQMSFVPPSHALFEVRTSDAVLVHLAANPGYLLTFKTSLSGGAVMGNDDVKDCTADPVLANAMAQVGIQGVRVF